MSQIMPRNAKTMQVLFLDAPIDNRGQLEKSVGDHMKTQPTKRLAAARQGVFANIGEKTHARLQRRAPAAHLSAAKYTSVALEFYLDLEDAFGGPMTDQFRDLILRSVSGMSAKLEKILTE